MWQTEASASDAMSAHWISGASVLRIVSEFGGDVFCKSILLNPSDRERHTVTHHKGPLAEDIREEERELQALLCLDYSMPLSVKTFDCSLHAFDPSQSMDLRRLAPN